MTAQSAAVREAEGLRDQLAAFEGALPARRLDPRLVRASVWANRHEDALTGADFEQLKTDIEAAGGNVQPIKVRPLAPAAEGGLRGRGLDRQPPRGRNGRNGRNGRRAVRRGGAVRDRVRA